MAESQNNLLSNEYTPNSRSDIEFLPLPTSEADADGNLLSPLEEADEDYDYAHRGSRVPIDERQKQKSPFKDRLSFALSVFNLMNVILGSGILGLAEVVKNLGIISFSILLVLTSLLAAYQINILLHSSKIANVKTYEGLAEHSFGLKGKVVTSIMIILHCLGALISYLYIIKNEFPEVLKALAGFEEQPGDDIPIYFNGDFLVLMILICVIAPLSTLKDIRFLGYTSAFGMFCMFFFTVTVIIKKFSIPCPLPIDHFEPNTSRLDIEGNQTCKPEYFTITARSAYALPTMVFAFMCHASMLPIYSELRRPTLTKMQKVANVSIFNIFSLYFCTAIFGYLTFYIMPNWLQSQRIFIAMIISYGQKLLLSVISRITIKDRTQSELLLSYSLYNSKDILVIIARMMVIICVMFSVPLLHYPARKTIILTVFRDPHVFSWFRHIGIMIGNLSLSALLVFLVPNIRDIFGMSGATSSMSLLIVFPCGFFLKLTANDKELETKYKTRRKVAWVMAVFGIIFMILSIALILIDWLT